jgi:hypothetical protein
MQRRVFALGVCLSVGLAGLMLGVSGGRTDEPAKQDKADQAKPDPAKEFAAIQKDWNDAQQAFFKAYGQAKTNEERQKLLKEQRPKPDAYVDRCLKLAEQSPESPQATQALFWAASNGRGTPAAKKAIAKLKDTIIAKADLDQLQKSLSGAPAFALGDLAPAVLEKVKKDLDHPKAVPLLMWVCQATMYAGGTDLGKLYDSTVDLLVGKFPEHKELAPLCQMLAQDQNPAWAEKHLRTLLAKNPAVGLQGKFALASLLANKDEASQPEAEKLLQSVVEELGNPEQKDANMLKEAKAELADIRVRGIGKTAPEIAGDDLDGKAFKLADYKGKVVLLDFWGFW